MPHARKDVVFVLAVPPHRWTDGKWTGVPQGGMSGDRRQNALRATGQHVA